MRYATALAALGLLLAVTGTAEAITLVFDPNDILDKYPSDSTGLKVSQPNARRVHATWANTYYGTFSDALQDGHSQPEDYNTYMNWREGLGTDEGIAIFQSWFLNNSAAQSWGETTVLKPGSTVSATASDGWNWRIIKDPYSSPGYVVQWWTTDSAKRLRPTDLGGVDIGEFSITANLMFDDDADGVGDRDVELGDSVRWWLGALNDDDAPFYRDDTQAVYFDATGWGSRTAYAEFAADMDGSGYGSGFEAVLESTAVPEPVTMAGLVLGIGALGGYVRRRRKA